MKTCTKCNLEKDLSGFNKEPGGANGLKSYCKSCQSEANRLYREKNKSYFRQKGAEFYSSHKEERKQYAQNYVALNGKKRYSSKPEFIRQYEADWRKSNPHKITAYGAKYRASKLQATPNWLTQEHFAEIQEFYSLAQELAWLNQDGKAFHVDHIVPLQGKHVCGLHVPWNLQLLPASDNLKKSNKI